MKRLALAITMALAITATASLHAQSVYGEFTASNLPNGPQGDYIYGGTTGVMLDVAHFGKHIYMAGDLQGRFVAKNGEMLDTLTLGPRFTFPFKRLHGFIPYASVQVGLGRYSDASVHGTTDDIYGTNGGIMKRVSKRFDVVVDYSFMPYGAFLGKYDTQTYSAGAIFYLHKR